MDCRYLLIITEIFLFNTSSLGNLKPERVVVKMEVSKIVVMVEDVEAARTALKWALNNLLRYGDLITLLHVFPSTGSRNMKKIRILRLKGFHLALSFKDICDRIPEAKVEIIVTEGDQEGRTIVSMVREIGASTLVLGLHDQSFLYKLAMTHNNITNILSCKVLAIKQPLTAENMDFSQIEITRLCVPQIPQPKIPYQILPSPSRIIWRRRREST
ncbi:hypothetical protein HHK36_024331 [Tetracentron sinense]|uniref:UspA domain-containing protein n=1 Tax=Tetracentron sinense TaxID=13715 RepID=A0A834YPK8_TETSI|nr:hypothetical protein HHK36_024331 [Tetracentron sinense]